LLSEAQPKNALVTPTPHFGNKFKHLRERMRRVCYVAFFTIYIQCPLAILHF
jgi:phage-related protein